jgi:putative membrane protein
LSQTQTPTRRGQTAIALGLILACYACARVLEITSTPIPRTAIVALDVSSAMAFALVDGARHYRLRGILAFAVICTVVGNLVENLGVATGFPFGHYYFAVLIVGDLNAPAAGIRVLTLPVVASFVMVAWDLAQDPIWATALHGWVWRDGGPWFGVPISNYLGWYGNVFTIYLLFAFYLRRYPAPAIAAPSALRPALVFYVLCAAGNVLQIISPLAPAVVQDPTGKQWRYADIAGASALVSIFVMGAFAAVAWIRLAEQEKAATD